MANKLYIILEHFIYLICNCYFFHFFPCHFFFRSNKTFDIIKLQITIFNIIVKESVITYSILYNDPDNSLDINSSKICEI